MQCRAIFPIEIVIPYPTSKRIPFQMSAKPITGRNEFLFTILTLAMATQVVVAQSPLRNRDRVMLQPDLAPVVKLRNSSRIVRPCIVRLLAKQHVVFAEPMKTSGRIYPRRLMPKTEMTSSRGYIRAENAPIILQRSHNWTLARQTRITGSA